MNGAHAHFSYLITEFGSCMDATVAVEMEDEVDPWLGYPNLFIVIGGHYIFRDKSVKIYVDVTYMWYFCGMKLVNDFAWGAAALTHLYMELNVAFYFRMYKWSFSIKEFFLLIRATKNKLFRRIRFWFLDETIVRLYLPLVRTLNYHSLFLWRVNTKRVHTKWSQFLFLKLKIAFNFYFCQNDF